MTSSSDSREDIPMTTEIGGVEHELVDEDGTRMTSEVSR